MTPRRAQRLAEARVATRFPEKTKLVDRTAIVDGVLTDRPTGRLLTKEEALVWELTRRQLKDAVETEYNLTRESK